MNAPVETAVAQATKPTSIDLARLDLTDVALAQFGPWQDQVADATKHFTTLVVDMPTQAKVDDFKSMRQRMINAPLAAHRATSKHLKSKLNNVSKDVGAKLEEIEAAWAGVDQLITPQIDKRQQELDEGRAEKARIETERKEAHQAKIAKIRACVEQAKGIAAERITKGIALVDGMTFGADCEEFLPQYEAAKADTLTAMRALLAEARAREAAEAQRIKNERVAAELARKAKELEAEAAAMRAQRVAITHAAVFAFPAPEPEPEPAAPAASPAPASLADQSNQAADPAAITPPPAEAPRAVTSVSAAAFRPAPAPAAEVVWIKTADVAAALGLPVNAELLATLGYPGTKRTGPGMWWDDEKVEHIAIAVQAHVRKSLSAYRTRTAVPA